MKRILTTVLAVITAISLFSQAPQAFKYQAVARNASGEVLSNKEVSFRISLLQVSTNGQAVYIETHDTVTNQYGLVNLEIGNGQLVSGSFSIINWSSSTYFLQIELDTIDGTNYQIMGTTQLLSVPYSLNSLTSNSLVVTSPNGTNYRVIVDDNGNLTTQFACGATFVDTRDEQTYNTVQIGNQCWMAENLKYLPSVYPPDYSYTEPRYYVHGYNGNDIEEAKATANYQNYGALYNFPAAETACPAGWLLPSDSERTQLYDFLGGASIAGGKMKSIRTEPDPEPRWFSPNAGATNESGFSGLPGSQKMWNNWSFPSIGYEGWWWTSTYAYEENYYSFYVTHLEDNGGSGLYGKSNGLSVRCIKN